jgi:general secretion pathway protein G
MVPSRRRRNTAGFSLIELMVVIAIMGLLATVVAVNLMGRSYGAKVVKVQADFDAIGKGVKLFYLDCGRYPQQISDLWQAPGNSKNWKGPYLENTPPAPNDPWGNPYNYTPPMSGTHYVLTCYGSDGAPGGTGDAQDLTTDNIQQIAAQGQGN